MMKQILLFVFILLSLEASAHDIEVKNADDVTIYYNYINDGKELEVTYQGNYYTDNSNEYTGNINIPSEVTIMSRTRKVTSIGDDAFRDCTGLVSVIIPNSVISIGFSAFSGCSFPTYGYGGNSYGGLSSVTIGKSVTTIRYDAFRDCNNLKKVIVHDVAAWCRINFGGNSGDYFSNPLYYAQHIYKDENTEIKDLVIPNSVTEISNYAFHGCVGLSSITIPNSVTSIGREAFNGCSGLTSVTIPNSVTSVGVSAFSGCSGLTSITIPNSVTSIESSAFKGCYRLTSVTIPNSVTSIGYNAFSGCSGLTFITIPNSVTSIGNSAFSGCKKLSSITIPNSVMSIESQVFYHCDALTTITIPNSVASIGQEAFSGCYSLTSVIIPNSVTSIGREAFNGCSGLNSITIGSGVKSIEDYAFTGADIPTVISLIENPFAIYGKTSNGRIFSQNTFNNATLYVPKGTIDKYKATDGWKDFWFIEEGFPAGIDAVVKTKSKNDKTHYYDLNGRKLSEKPAQKGVYISKGRKVVVK